MSLLEIVFYDLTSTIVVIFFSYYSLLRHFSFAFQVTGGRNGFGAKLCNVFSTKFTVETAYKDSKKEFRQSWAGNMSKAAEPKIKEYPGSDYTRITFQPDLVSNTVKLDTNDHGYKEFSS